MPFTDTTDTIESVLTDTGRDLLAKLLLGEVSFQLIGFKVGVAGYLDANPVKLDQSPDPTLSDLRYPVFPVPTTATQAFFTIEQPFPNVLAAVCRIGRSEALHGLGELGVWVRILRSTGSAASTYTVGEDYMFGLANMPMQGKTDKQVFVFRYIIAT